MAAPLAQQLEELLNPRPDLRDPEDDAEEGERGSEKGSVRVGAGRVGQGPAASCRAGAARGARGAAAAAAAAGVGGSGRSATPLCVGPQRCGVGAPAVHAALPAATRRSSRSGFDRGSARALLQAGTDPGGNFQKSGPGGAPRSAAAAGRALSSTCGPPWAGGGAGGGEKRRCGTVRERYETGAVITVRLFPLFSRLKMFMCLCDSGLRDEAQVCLSRSFPL